MVLEIDAIIAKEIMIEAIGYYRGRHWTCQYAISQILSVIVFCCSSHHHIYGIYDPSSTPLNMAFHNIKNHNLVRTTSIEIIRTFA